MPEALQERMYEWTEDKIRWYQDACLYQGNNRNQVILQALFKYMGERETICDLGCGIGSLSLALSSKVKKVIAIDQNEAALSFLKQKAAEEQAGNIEIIRGDYKQLAPKMPPAESALLCMAGSLEKSLPYVKRWADKRLFYITGDSPYHSFKPGKKHSYTSPQTIEALLEQEHLSYEEEMLKVRFGQPLKSREEAEAFLSCYNREGKIEKIRADLEEKLISTKDQSFPWYYPCDKTYRLYVIHL